MSRDVWLIVLPVIGFGLGVGSSLLFKPRTILSWGMPGAMASAFMVTMMIEGMIAIVVYPLVTELGKCVLLSSFLSAAVAYFSMVVVLIRRKR